MRRIRGRSQRPRRRATAADVGPTRSHPRCRRRAPPALNPTGPRNAAPNLFSHLQLYS